MKRRATGILLAVGVLIAIVGVAHLARPVEEEHVLRLEFTVPPLATIYLGSERAGQTTVERKTPAASPGFPILSNPTESGVREQLTRNGEKILALTLRATLGSGGDISAACYRVLLERADGKLDSLMYVVVDGLPSGAIGIPVRGREKGRVVIDPRGGGVTTYRSGMGDRLLRRYELIQTSVVVVGVMVDDTTGVDATKGVDGEKARSFWLESIPPDAASLEGY